MTQVVLPNTITAGTPMVASQVQGDLQALRDVVNGGLEGGTTVDSNMKAKGLTMRELDAAALKYAGVTASLQQGVLASGELAVTPGAGLQLNYAAGRAFVPDDGSIHTSGILIPANVLAGGSVTIAANSSGNPRIDQVVLTLTGVDTGSVSVLQGTATAGATLDNRTGAAALPAKTLRLADVLVANGFAGPFVVGTSLRDRRPWAKGALAGIRRNSNAAGGSDYTGLTSTSPTSIDATNLKIRIETNGGPVRVTLHGDQTVSAVNTVTYYIVVDGTATQVQSLGQTVVSPGAALLEQGFTINWWLSPAAGSHTFEPWYAVSTGSLTLLARSTHGLNYIVEEYARPETLYNGNA